MFTGEPLVISIPACELAHVAVTGSVFDTKVMEGASISADLRIAVDLVTAAYRRGGATEPLRCVARPEIFTHGPSLNWLQNALGPIKQHLCLSDGTSVKLIPQLRNHLFTYGIQSHQRYVDFKKLMRRAPELLAQYDSQINSFHCGEYPDSASEPSSTMLLSMKPLAAAALWSFGFYLNPHSLEDSAEHMLKWGEIEEPPLAEFQKITYIPLTEAAANDANFQRRVAEMIAPIYFDPTQCLLIRLPMLESELTTRMTIALDGIRRSRVHLPQARSKNIFFLSGDLSEEAMAPIRSRLKLVLHQTFEFWRYTGALYQEAQEITVYIEADRTSLLESARNFYMQAFGRAPRFMMSHRSSRCERLAE